MTPATIESVVLEAQWLSTAWDLANLYLGSCDAQVLSRDARPLLGLSEETTCYVSVDYFRGTGRFDPQTLAMDVITQGGALGNAEGIAFDTHGHIVVVIRVLRGTADRVETVPAYGERSAGLPATREPAPSSVMRDR